MAEAPFHHDSLRVLRLLGEGAGGEVWLVEVTEALGSLALRERIDVGERIAAGSRIDVGSHLAAGSRIAAGARIAAKVPRAGDAAAAARVRHEARLGRRVVHPGLPHVYELLELDVPGLDVLELEDGRPLLLLELVEGATLRERLEELGRLPEALLRPVALAAAEALEALHAAGVVHRDLKPENLVLTLAGEVKLLDLGLAWDERGGAGESADFVGTLEYAAPELRGSGRASAASDRFALGAMLHELASGRAPAGRRGGGAAPLGALVPAVSDWLEEVVDTLLSAEPTDRFASSSELVEVLREAEDSAWWAERRQGGEVAGRRSWWPGRPEAAAAFVGRDAELDSLLEAFARAELGRGGFVLVEGEAGLGKSRLAAELVARLESERRPVLGLHGDASLLPRLTPLALALHRRFGAVGLHRALSALEDVPAVQRAAVADFALGRGAGGGSMGGGSAGGGSVGGGSAGGGTAGGGTAGRSSAGGGSAGALLAEGLARLLRSLASRGPVLWIVEDLHAVEPEERARVERA